MKRFIDYIKYSLGIKLETLDSEDASEDTKLLTANEARNIMLKVEERYRTINHDLVNSRLESITKNIEYGIRGLKRNLFVHLEYWFNQKECQLIIDKLQEMGYEVSVKYDEVPDDKPEGYNESTYLTIKW